MVMLALECFDVCMQRRKHGGEGKHSQNEWDGRKRNTVLRRED